MLMTLQIKPIPDVIIMMVVSMLSGGLFILSTASMFNQMRRPQIIRILENAPRVSAL